MAIIKASRAASLRAWLRYRTHGRRKCACATVTITSVVVLVAIFALTAYNLRRNRFSVNHFNIHVGDEVAVSRFSDDLSSKFCAAYEIELWDHAQVYKLPSRAKTDEADQRKDHLEITYVNRDPLQNALGFYLLKNSSVTAKGCHAPHDPSQIPGEMTLLKSRDDDPHPSRHHRRCRGADCEDRVVKRVRIPSSAVCNSSSSSSSSSSLPELEYTVEDEGYYYVTLGEESRHGGDEKRHHHHADGGLVLTGFLLRTSYDVSANVSVCQRHLLCRFSLGFDDDDDADFVIKIANDAVTPMSRSSFSTHCLPRILFWVGIFGGTPLVLVVFVIAFWVWLFCVKMKPVVVDDDDDDAGEGRYLVRHSRSSSMASEAESADGGGGQGGERLAYKARTAEVYYQSVQQRS